MSSQPRREPDSSPTDRPKLQKLSETGQRVFQCLSLGLVVFDDQLNIIHHNPAADFLVQDHGSIADALDTAIVDAQYQDWREALREVIDNGRQHRFEQLLYRDSVRGELLLNLLCIALTDQTGRHITGGTLVIEDVTAAVSMEKRLAVSERMAAVGKLAARVAHELNNPLDGILRYLSLATRALDRDMDQDIPNKVPEYLTQARGGLLRMAEIVRELVEFSRTTLTAVESADLNAIVEESIKVMSDKAVENSVSIVCSLTDRMPAIHATNLFQVFCNLIKNAVDAMPDGGTLTINTKVADPDAVLTFADTGTGLPEEMHRIFEPFFTTKPPGKGTGLGLAVCKDIIEKHNGAIEPGRRPGGGTIFTIRLPLNDRSSARSIGSSPTPKPGRTRFTSPTKETDP